MSGELENEFAGGGVFDLGWGGLTYFCETLLQRFTATFRDSVPSFYPPRPLETPPKNARRSGPPNPVCERRSGDRVSPEGWQLLDFLPP